MEFRKLLCKIKLSHLFELVRCLGCGVGEEGMPEDRRGGWEADKLRGDAASSVRLAASDWLFFKEEESGSC